MARPELWLCRHGQTDWSRDGRHTSHTDLLLTPAGVAEAQHLVAPLAAVAFDLVLTSPLRRARDTAELLGFPDARREPALAEWDYGEYEGMTTQQIRERDAGWTVWSHPVPGGETADQVATRADRVIERVLDEGSRRALLVAHGHLLRVLAARWVGEEPAFGAHLVLDTATLSVLGWERGSRALVRWNATAANPRPEPGTPPESGSGRGAAPP